MSIPPVGSKPVNILYNRPYEKADKIEAEALLEIMKNNTWDGCKNKYQFIKTTILTFGRPQKDYKNARAEFKERFGDRLKECFPESQQISNKMPNSYAVTHLISCCSILDIYSTYIMILHYTMLQSRGKVIIKMLA